MILNHGFLFLALLAAAVSLTSAAPVSVPDGGKNMIAGSTPHGVVPKNGEATVTREAQPELGDVWRIAISKTPPNTWSVQLGTRVTGSIKEGDRCLLAFQARAAEGKKAIGATNVEIQEPPDYFKVGKGAFSVGTDWTPVYTSFIASKDVPDGKGSVAIHLGGALQTIEIAQVQLLNYGPDFDLAKLPRARMTYEGREANAPWRQAALARIEKLRKGRLDLAVVDAAGLPVPDAEVHAELKRNAFGFGAAVTAKWLADPTADGEKYRAIVDQQFSRVVFENDLKPFAWENYNKAAPTGSFRKAWLDQSFAWLAERHISVRGHYLAWAPFEPWSEKLKSTPQAIREKVLTYLRECTPVVGDRVIEWDALNHPAAWEKGICIDTVLGDGFYTEVFQEARKITKLPLWINEDQVFRPGRQQEEYFACIQKLLAAGVKIDGIGNQAHLDASLLPSPEELLANSDRFAKLVPALQITEYDITTAGDEQLAADYTRDLLILCYSHPAYTGFVMWGFWEGSHWKPETALWRRDWSEKPNAKVWQEWVTGQWKTNTTVRSNAKGQANLDGHFGRYEITVSKGGKTSKQEIDFVKGRTDAITLTLK